MRRTAGGAALLERVRSHIPVCRIEPVVLPFSDLFGFFHRVQIVPVLVLESGKPERMKPVSMFFALLVQVAQLSVTHDHGRPVLAFVLKHQCTVEGDFSRKLNPFSHVRTITTGPIHIKTGPRVERSRPER